MLRTPKTRGASAVRRTITYLRLLRYLVWSSVCQLLRWHPLRSSLSIPSKHPAETKSELAPLPGMCQELRTVFTLHTSY